MNNIKYKNMARAFFELLLKKYNLKNRDYSIRNFENLNVELANIKKIINYVDSNNIRNVIWNLKKLDEKSISITKEMVDEFDRLLEYHRNKNSLQNSYNSKLEAMFDRLSVKSKEAIVNENEFDDFKRYMHIERQIEKDFINLIHNHLVPNQKAIIFLAGNVGDGKSHLISYVKSKYNDVFVNKNIKVHNDATETISPNFTALETLIELLQPFNDDNIDNDEPSRLIVAINMGVFTRLYEALLKENNFSSLTNYIRDTKLLNAMEFEDADHSLFKTLSFVSQSNIEVRNDTNSLESSFFKNILQKVFGQADNNPFYKAYLEDKNKRVEKIIHKNYELMMRKDFQESLTYLLIRAELEHNTIISTRMLFNLIHDICVSENKKGDIDSYLPYLIFQNSQKSELLKVISKLDPIKNQTKEIDSLAVELYLNGNTYNKIGELLGEEKDNLFFIFQSFQDNNERFNDFINTFLRLQFLINYKNTIFDNKIYNLYVESFINVRNKTQDSDLLNLIDNAFYKWNGEIYKNKFIVINPQSKKIKILVKRNLVFKGYKTLNHDIIMDYEVNNDRYKLVLNYKTYRILCKLRDGYFLKYEDRQNAINFDGFIKSILTMKIIDEEIYLYNGETKSSYELSQSFFGDFSLRKE